MTKQARFPVPNIRSFPSFFPDFHPIKNGKSTHLPNLSSN